MKVKGYFCLVAVFFSNLTLSGDDVGEKIVTENCFEKAFEVANLMTDEQSRSSAFNIIIYNLCDAGDFNEALGLILAFPEEEQLHTLSHMIISLVERGLVEKSIETALMPANLKTKITCLENISWSLADKEHTNPDRKRVNSMMIELIHNCSDEELKDELLQSMCSMFVWQGECEQTLMLSESFSDETKKHEVLKLIVSHFFGSQICFETSLEIARSLPDKWMRDQVFLAIISKLAEGFDQKASSATG